MVHEDYISVHNIVLSLITMTKLWYGDVNGIFFLHRLISFLVITWDNILVNVICGSFMVHLHCACSGRTSRTILGKIASLIEELGLSFTFWRRFFQF